MKQEDRELLLKDLSTRLPYKVYAQILDEYESVDYTAAIENIDIDGFITDFEGNQIEVEYIKPYLFPMSNITEEQYELLKKSGILSNCSHSYEYVTNIYGSSFIFKGFKTYSLELIEYLNKNHFDYRGLIEKGLANDATNRNIY